MLELKFEEDVLRARLSNLSAGHRAIFAACCAERLCPVYQDFLADMHLKDAGTLNAYLSNVWKSLIYQVDVEINWDEILENCLILMPPEDSQSLESAAYAEDAVAAVSYAIRTKISGEPNEAAWAARRVYEAVDQYVIRARRRQGKVSFDEADILRHPACQRELRSQMKDLADLENAGKWPLSTEFISSLRERAILESKSLFKAE